MGAWMSYLHMQMPIPTDVVGVPVSLDAVDPNGNYLHIADVTTDMSGTYSFIWEPELAGKYVVTATFTGDDSYGSSYAETAIGVVEAPATATPSTSTITMPPFETYFVATAAVIVIAIAVATVLLLRKRP